jgi:hemolysin activation/secretion protein
MVSSLLLGSSLLGATPPSSSDILRQAEPPKLPQEVKTIPSIKSGEFKAPMADDKGAKIKVSGFTISNNTVFSDEVLLSLIQEYKGQELSIAGLNEVASIITKYYRDKGYFVARAYIPAQELDKDNAVVEIAVIEGLYGEFTMKNSSLVDTHIVQGFMDKLKGGDVVSTLSLERQMLLINDLSGARVTNAEIFPGVEVGQSDFTITIEDEAKYYGYAIVDNYGSRYTGEYRLNIAGFVNSLTNRGDVLGVSALSSNTSNLTNARVSYETPIGYDGLKANFALSQTDYEIAKEFKNLDIKGSSISFDAGLSYPIIKTRAHTLEISSKYNHKKSTDKDNYQDDRKKNVDSISLALNDRLNTSWFGRGGILNSSVGLTAGKVNLNSYAKSIDDANTDGNYEKLSFSISQNQSINKNLSLLASISAQTSLNKNLDGGEDFSVGGAYGVRAYGDSELSGDKGYLASLELTNQLPSFRGIDHSISAFIDHAKVWDNQKDVLGVSPQSRYLNAIGIGYNANYKNASIKATYAYGFGPDNATTSEGKHTSANKLLVQGMVRF